MPRERVVAESFRMELGLYASARRLDLRDVAKKGPAKVRKEDWQAQIWKFYDTIGEFHFACDWVGNLLSKAELYVAKNGKRVESGAAVEGLKALYGGKKGQKEMLRTFGVHLTAVGECYLIGEDPGEDAPDEWRIISNLKIKQVREGYIVQGENDGQPQQFGIVLQLFRPHPVNPKNATSPARSVLPILRELDGLTMALAAQIDSRLIGSGLLFIPNEVSFPSMPIMNGDGDDASQSRAGVDGFQDMLIDAASLAITHPEAASAKVPIVVQIPGERIGEIKHQTFWSDYDSHTLELRTEAIRRIALGMDMPPEALTGTAEMNHWNAWQLEEAAIKVHTEPLLDLITDALTEKYLWPYLFETLSEEEAYQYTIEADTTELRLRPNRSKEAQELYDRGALSLDAMLRENGFDPADKMGTEEMKDWFLRKVASGSTTPELVASALAALDVPLVLTQVTDDETPDQTREARPIPSLLEHPTREIPEEPDPAMLAAAEGLVMRALERAGNKLKNRLSGFRPQGVSAVDVYQYVPVTQDELDNLLDGAWDHVGRLSVNVPCAQLDSYARTLILSRKPHDFALMKDYLCLTQGAA